MSSANQLPGFRGVETLLEQARVDLSSGTFLIVSVGLGLGFRHDRLGPLGSSCDRSRSGGALRRIPPIFSSLARGRNRRFKQFEEEFPEALDLLTRAIRAGHPLSSGMQMVGEEGPRRLRRNSDGLRRAAVRNPLRRSPHRDGGSDQHGGCSDLRHRGSGSAGSRWKPGRDPREPG